MYEIIESSIQYQELCSGSIPISQARKVGSRESINVMSKVTELVNERASISYWTVEVQHLGPSCATIHFAPETINGPLFRYSFWVEVYA